MERMQALLIGGTRNLGPGIAGRLIRMGYRVTVLNRGLTPGEIPAGVRRLVADRGDAGAMEAALHGTGTFDAVVDTTLYTGTEAAIARRLLVGRAGRYVMLSTGQVYLVREGLQRPFREDTYPGLVMPEPDGPDRDDWLYGVGKRAAEEELQAGGLDTVILRLPMVISARDHYERLFNYIARLADGGPILVPAGPHPGLRHVFGEDVVEAVARAIRHPAATRVAINVGQDETLGIDEALGMAATALGVPLRIARIPRAALEAGGLLPAASPFSGRWMSALDNALGKDLLGIRYTQPSEYLPRLAVHFREELRRRTPAGYAQRSRELALVESLAAG